ncbi:MAG: 4-diphosphocytidyl-2-C-methyl-D-erythritol kinase [Pseudohongiellaceae bacterium]|jgi:4-diphosphocytidyl-2-C-methyl-D-erythritol kinase
MLKTQIKLFCPAKLNLFLHVLGRRDDGYHDLQTLFCLLDFGDEMTFSAAGDGILTLHIESSLELPLPMDNNLVIKAAKALRHLTNKPLLGADISLVKKIPQGAGLGGGSSNAASTLLALNALWNLKLSTEELCEIGIKLGADVPVFLHRKSAWGEGIGEKLAAVELDERWYLVITPPCLVSTQEIFCHQQLTRNSPAIKIADFLAGRSRNDCEAITRKLYPEVANTLYLLNKFAKSRMTGTGSSVFAEFNSEVDAMATLAKLPKPLQVFVAKGINSLDERLVGD